MQNMIRHVPIDFLVVFFDEEMLNLVIEKTEEYAVNLFLAHNTREHFRVIQWKNFGKRCNKLIYCLF